VLVVVVVVFMALVEHLVLAELVVVEMVLLALQ
jgi:hypothetical protein